MCAPLEQSEAPPVPAAIRETTINLSCKSNGLVNGLRFSCFVPLPRIKLRNHVQLKLAHQVLFPCSWRLRPVPHPYVVCRLALLQGGGHSGSKSMTKKKKIQQGRWVHDQFVFRRLPGPPFAFCFGLMHVVSVSACNVWTCVSINFMIPRYIVRRHSWISPRGAWWSPSGRFIFTKPTRTQPWSC